MFKPNFVNWKPMEPSYWVQVKSIVIFNIYQHFNPNENPPSPLLVIVKRLIITTLRLSSVGWTQDRRHRSGTSTRDHFPHWKSEQQWTHSPSLSFILSGRLGICRDRRDRRSCKIFVSCVNFFRKQRSFLLILQVYTHLNVNFLHNC